MTINDQDRGSQWRIAIALPLLLLGGLTGGATAADLGNELAELGAVVDARIDSATGRERAKLLKAALRLDTTDGSASAADLRRVLKSVYATKTADAQVLSEAGDVLDCLRSLAATERVDAEQSLEVLTGKFFAKIEKALQAADKRFDAGLDALAANPAKATSLLKSAFDKYVKAAALGRKLEQKQYEASLPSIPKARQVVATLTGTGMDETFRGFSLLDEVFDNALLQGCDTVAGGDECERVLNIGFFYQDGSRETGPRAGFSLRYEDLTGGGSLVWSGSGVVIDVTRSTGGVLQGRFEGVATAEGDHQPQQIAINGAFTARRR